MTAMTAPLFRFDVPGLPVAKGRARSRIIKPKGGKKAFSTHYTPAETRNYEAVVRDLAALARRAVINRQRPDAPANSVELERGPLKLVLVFRFPVPDSWPKWKTAAALAGEVRHTKKPDCSNLAKAIEDACNQVLYVDDGQIVETTQRKEFSRVPGVQVDVYRLLGVASDASQAEHKAAMAAQWSR